MPLTKRRRASNESLSAYSPGRDLAPAISPSPQAALVETRPSTRKERNRISAQKSRERQKAYVISLEGRVQELEKIVHDSNNGCGSSNTGLVPDATNPSNWDLTRLSQLESENVRLRKENEELKRSMKTLEEQWDIVLRALESAGSGPGASSIGDSQLAASRRASSISPPLTIPEEVPSQLHSHSALSLASSPLSLMYPRSEPESPNERSPLHSQLDFESKSHSELTSPVPSLSHLVESPVLSHMALLPEKQPSDVRENNEGKPFADFVSDMADT